MMSNYLGRLEDVVGSKTGLDGIRKSAENLNNSPRKISPFYPILFNLASGHISIKYNFKGPNHSVVTLVLLVLMP